jgi:hypothetical protein
MGAGKVSVESEVQFSRPGDPQGASPAREARRLIQAPVDGLTLVLNLWSVCTVLSPLD